MTAPCEKVIDPADGKTFVMFDFGDAVGVVDPADTIPTLEYWRDHAGSGAGCNNWILDAFGRELDLEFCSSRGLTQAELKAVRAAIGAS